ncbi:DUF5947 family protein [Pseudonocardia endophytica]|uniref:Uncharacterized protein n=1 Tax=Pseudonocardia endophytica TaxID=401976 RepID=A0A4R1HPJ5_PSEEN|nr:DUF5947 family protein [Pseudonocardia endophytica]TCK22330.1 hypothetical protein EV378_6331 [Pseudonocardia endophytica]
MTSLRRFLVRPEPEPERCELCATPVSHEHPHLVHVTDRRLVCACGPCSFLFDDPGAGQHRRVPDRCLVDPAFALDDGQWDALQIPVGMAFFLHNSVQDALVACYPSPAGATESELPSARWSQVSPLVAELVPDVEAVLVRREPSTCLLVPIDACYRLVGLVRLHWRGFDGGADAHAAVDAFFSSLLERASELAT